MLEKSARLMWEEADNRSTMADTDPPARWFGPGFVEAHRAKFGHRPPEQRQLTYDQAVADEYAPWRAWLDEQLAHLTPAQAAAAAGKVWLDESFWTVVFELAAGAALRERGLNAVYEAKFDDQTPDWTVLDEAGEPACFVEVHTDMPAPGTFGRMRAWHGLVQRIKQIPVPVVLTLAPSQDPIDPPDARTAKQIAQELRRQLLSILQPSPPVYRAYGYTFLAMGAPKFGGHRLLESPFGLGACFEPPSCTAGFVSADRLLVNVEAKVGKYRALSQRRRVPLVVAVGSHKFTGVTLDNLDNALRGSDSPMFSMQFGFGDAFLVPEITIEMKPAEPWPMPADLAALMWVDTAFPFTVDLRPNPAATLPLPEGFAITGRAAPAAAVAC